VNRKIIQTQIQNQQFLNTLLSNGFNSQYDLIEKEVTAAVAYPKDYYSGGIQSRLWIGLPAF
jgi:hypothetical protein